MPKITVDEQVDWDLDKNQPHFYAHDADYPVTLAQWHWNMNRVATPISGDKSIYDEIVRNPGHDLKLPASFLERRN